MSKEKIKELFKENIKLQTQALNILVANNQQDQAKDVKRQIKVNIELYEKFTK